MARLSSSTFGGAVAAAVLAIHTTAHAADIDHGRALARQWCASCHTVEATTATARDTAPSFASIARRPDVSDSSLRGWLNTPHPTMPNFELSRAAIEDLVAYIRSMK